MKRAARSKEPAIRRVISILLVFMLLIGTTGLASSVRAAGDEGEPSEEIVFENPAEGTEDSDGEEESAQQPEENPAPAQSENEIPSEPTQENEPQEGEQGDSVGTSEGEAPKQEETVWTAKHFEGGANGIHVIVDAPEGALPELTTMVVTPVYDSAVLETIGSAADASADRVTAVDITFYDADKIPTEPKQLVSVTLKSEVIQASDSDVTVVHMDDAGEATVVDQEPNAKSDEVSFASKDFSVYAIVGSDLPQPPRVTYEFVDPNNADFTFLDTAGNPQKTQIIKNGEVLQDVGLPTIGAGQTYQGWYLYNGDTSVGKISFDTPISVAYGEAGSGSTITLGAITIDPEDLDDDGTLHVTVKAYFGDVIYLTFYEDAAGTNISNRIQLEKGASYNIAQQTVNAPTTELSFSGWSETPGTNDDTREPITDTTRTFTEDDSFYPIFKNGHWISFKSGATGSGATYRAPAFVPAGQNASVAEPAAPTWKGYTFQYWTETDLYTGTDGAYVQPTSAPARFNFNQPITEAKNLYAYWTPAQTTYTVVFWGQNITDSKNATNAQKTYSFIGQETKTANSGSTVNASNYSKYKSTDGKIDFSFGYDLNTTKSDTSIVVKADGTSVINIYQDRQLIYMKFYQNGNSTQAPGYTNSYYDTTTGNGRVTVYSGLYGQTLGMYNYSWPSGFWTYYTTGNGTGSMSFLGQFVLPDDVRDTTRQEIRFYYRGNAPQTFEFYLQNVDGSYPTTASDTGHSSMSRFTLSEKYDGFQAVQYRRYTGNHNWVDNSWVNGADGTQVNLNNGNYNLAVRYARKIFTLKYLDSVDSTELSGITTANIVYGGSLSDYEPAASFEPQSQYPGKQWDGKWYKDQACTEEFDWSVTMPNANMVVYAGWEDVYYKVDIDPNGGVLTSSESTFTWLTYGRTIEAYDDVVRDYVEDPAGTYKYENWLRSVYTANGIDPWDYSGYPRSAGYVSASANNSANLTPYSGTGSSVTVNYPYDSTRYRYEKGAYALLGWYEITFADGHYGDMAYKTGEKPYSFGTGVDHDTYIQAKWRRVGDYHVEYKVDVYLMDKNGNVTASDSGIDTTNCPTDGNSYADQSASAMMRAADSPITVGTGEDAKQYIFQGWYYNGQLYTPGDVFTVLASLAEDKVVGQDPSTQEDIIQKTIYIYPVYIEAENLPVDVTHIYWYSNFKDQDGKQIGSLTADTQYKDETNNELKPNEGIDILAISDLVPADDENYEGYTFKGWARVPTRGAGAVDVTSPSFNAANYMYLYWDGTDFHVNSETGTVVTQVAADENEPYHDMYAVWEINKYTVTVTKTVVGTADDQHLGFVFDPDFTGYTATGYDSNFILAGTETTFTPEDGGSSITYKTSKEFYEVPYGATLTLTETPGDDFTITSVTETKTTDADGTAIANPAAVDRSNGYTYTIQGDVTIAYTNTHKQQKVKIYKTDDATPANPLSGVGFTLDGNEYSTSSTGYTDVITIYTNADTPYTLTESTPLDYYTAIAAVDLSVTNDGVSVPEGTANVTVSEADADGVYTITVVNPRKVFKVTVKKLVTGNMADTNKAFAFTASYTLNGTTTQLDPFTLIHDGTKELQIPAGATLTVSETPEDYTPSNDKTQGGSTAEFEVTADNLTVTFTNNKVVIPDTGVRTPSIPFVLMMLISLTGLFAMFFERRRVYER